MPLIEDEDEVEPVDCLACGAVYDAEDGIPTTCEECGADMDRQYAEKVSDAQD